MKFLILIFLLFPASLKTRNLSCDYYAALKIKDNFKFFCVEYVYRDTIKYDLH